MHKTLSVTWKELLELRQDPRIYLIVLLAPVLQLTLLGYAATTDVENVPIVVADGDGSATSRALVERLAASRYFTVTEVVATTDDIDPFLSAGRAWLALSILPGLGEQLATGTRATIQIVADGTDANSANIALGYARTLVADYARELSAGRLPPSARDSAAVVASIRVWFNPELQSEDFMIPGVLALVLMVMTAILSSMAIVRERENGTLEQLNVTPISRWQVVGGKLLPYGLIGVVDVIIVVAVATLWFQVPVRGSLVLLFVCSLIYLVSGLGIGLFVSTVSQSQQQAMLTAVFFFLMPMLLLSGFVFPIENMPRAIQPVTRLVPLRYYLIIVRGIFLKGVGLDVLWPQMLALAGWGLGILGLAVARSSKRFN